MRVFLALLFILLATHCGAGAQASSPGMVEGPPGCDWEAQVVSADATSGVTLKLQKMAGSCMYEYGNCGKEGDTVTAPLDGKDVSAFAVGAAVHVWVSSAPGATAITASLKHPDCTRTPVAP